MDSAVIREAGQADIPRLVDLLGELFSLEHDFTPDAEKQQRGLRLILDHPERGRIFVARQGDEVIGMVNALFTISTAEGGPVILLEDLIIAAPHRGRGIGGLLVRHVLCWAQCKGFLRVTLLTDRDNAGAVGFYERNGFVRSGMEVLRVGLGNEIAQ